MDFFFFIRYYKEYFFPTCKFNFGKIFELPTEIMNLIILEFASSTSWNSKYWNSRQLIMLGLINKATLLAVNICYQNDPDAPYYAKCIRSYKDPDSTNTITQESRFACHKCKLYI